MIRRAILYFAFLLPATGVSFSQEVVTGLQSNPALAKHKDARSAKGVAADTLSLPVFDDFSGSSFTPDNTIWQDDFVFINNTYSINQITKGIATFDALDNSGFLYETSNPSGFMADQLTSQPVNLEYPASDNIWLSFLFEPGGLTDAPETNDSLTLQFFAPEENLWYSVWNAEGSEERAFRNVIIPVNHPRFLKRGFQFRFINYASLSQNLIDPSMAGNCDIWNIDYLLLDSNRNQGDTVFSDVAFRLPVRSLLKNYEAMPWKQFRQVFLQEMGSSISVHYRNNDAIVRNVTRDFEIWDVYRNIQSHQFSAGATNVEPRSNVDYNANLIYTYSTDNPDSALFRVICSLKTDEFDPKGNDTVIYNQVFRNYFAFDDGSSEGGYGINGLGSRNAMFAHRFTSFTRDTLRAIDICFNDSYQDANRRAFDIMVWDDNNGTPGNVLYAKEEVMVERGSEINGFYRYLIPGGVTIDGVFYVGWKQRSETFLNAGFDINTPHEGRQLYWLNGGWNPSQVQGTVMIRPVLGLPLTTGINDHAVKDLNKIKIWPNPAGDYISIGIEENPYSSSAYVCFIDLAGHELLKVPFTDVIDISSLGKGMYIIVTVVNGKRTGFNRLIKSR
jgi:hypothetical protein